MSTIESNGLPSSEFRSPEQTLPIHHDNTGSLADLARGFHKLFGGCTRAYGTYGPVAPDSTRSDGKLKGKAETIRAPVTDALWEKHLRGESMLGVIPVDDSGLCRWGALDIDSYQGLDHQAIAQQLVTHELPLIVCRSKSGGAHVLLLAAEPVPAKQMQERLKAIGALLGYAGAECFPKQVTPTSEKNLGSWLNMAYFDHEHTSRYAILPDNRHLSAEEFVSHAALLAVQPSWFNKPLPGKSDLLPDAPPCLNHLMQMKFPPGSWNTGIFNLAVYCRRAFGDGWKEKLAQLNAVNFPPDRWPVSDLMPIIKSVSKPGKSYFYQCSNSLLEQHCNKEVCRNRKYGIGNAASLPDLSSLTKLLTDPPVWYAELEGHRLKFSTEELFNPLAFQIVCGNANVVVRCVGRGPWVEHIRPFVTKVTEIPVSADNSGADDSSVSSYLLHHLEQFCTGRSQAHSMEEMAQQPGKPFTEAKRTHFKFFDLLRYLNRVNFKIKQNEVVTVLRDMGGINRQDRIGGKVVRYWSVPEFNRENEDRPLPLPDDTKAF